MPKGAKSKSMTKSEFYAQIATKTDLSKKQVAAVFDAIAAIVKAEFKAGRPLTLPGLVKMTLRRMPAKPARPGINPFTKERIMIKAKAAYNKVRVLPIKALKELAA